MRTQVPCPQVLFLQLPQLSPVGGVGVGRGRRLHWNVTSMGRLIHLVQLWLNFLLDDRNITFHHCQWAFSQRHDLFQKYWYSWCLHPPKVVMFCVSSSSVFSLQHSGLGWTGCSHRNHRGCAHSRSCHRVWDPTAGQCVCHGDSLFSTSDFLYWSWQPGWEVRCFLSPASFPALHFLCWLTLHS